MILTLLLAGLSIAFIVGLIIALRFDCDDLTLAGICFPGSIALLGAIVCGIWTIKVNVPSFAKTEEYKLKETVKLFQNQREIIESFHLVNEGNKTEFTSDITLETVSTTQYYQKVEDYNTKIFDFKTDCIAHKNRRSNPWLSWFESAAWDAITEEYLENLTYTIGK